MSTDEERKLLVRARNARYRAKFTKEEWNAKKRAYKALYKTKCTEEEWKAKVKAANAAYKAKFTAAEWKASQKAAKARHRAKFTAEEWSAKRKATRGRYAAEGNEEEWRARQNAYALSYYQKNRPSILPAKRRQDTARRRSLGDAYIRHLIQDTTGLRATDIPQEMVEARRQSVMLNRLIKEMKHENAE